MGFISGLISKAKSVGSAISDGAKTVGRRVKKVYDTAKETAEKAVGWLAEKGDKMVEDTKKVWEGVKKSVRAAAIVTKVAAMAFPHPALIAVAGLMDKAHQRVMDVDRVLATKIFPAAERAVEMAKVIHAKNQAKKLSKQEEKAILEDQEVLRRSYNIVQTEQEKASLRYSLLVNDYLLVQNRIDQIVEQDDVKDFEHYLRLRATQKLLKSAEKSIAEAKDATRLKDDDVFLMKIANDLLDENPQLSDQDAVRLDELIKRRYAGKSLLPFVFEEMIAAWEVRYQNMKEKWNQLNTENASIERDVIILETRMKIQPLTAAEEVHLVELKNDLKINTHQLKEQAEENRAMQSYVHAAEGFLQVLEKSAEEFVAEDRDYLLDDASTVGMLIIDCAQNGKRWSDLTNEEKSLIRDYAHIFAKDAKNRQEQIMQEAASEIEVKVA